MNFTIWTNLIETVVRRTYKRHKIIIQVANEGLYYQAKMIIPGIKTVHSEPALSQENALLSLLNEVRISRYDFLES